MTRYWLPLGALVVCQIMGSANCRAQSSSSDASQDSSQKPAVSPPETPVRKPAAPADAKKTKKVWTNEDVNGLSGPVSVVGDTKNIEKASSNEKADGQYILNTRKEVLKLQSQLEDTDKQLRDLKNFSEGKASATTSGYQINKGYNRVPVDQQITGLEDKKKQLAEKIATLLDEARKKGVEPGQLR